MKRRGPKPKGKTERKWSPKTAYSIGLITTDGSLSKDGRHINFTSKDLQLVKLFKKCLKLDVSIGKKLRNSSDKSKYFQIQFGDILFYEWLLDIGLMPNKSKILKKIAVSDKYFFDFLRGCFDGDGSMYAYWDPRWRSSYMFYIQFTSASPSFLLWLQHSIFRLLGIKGRIGQSDRSQYLRFAKKHSKILFDKMFHKEDVPCLQRKFIKSKKIFDVDKKHG